MDASGGYDALITDGVKGSPYGSPGRTGRRSHAQHRPVGGHWDNSMQVGSGMVK